MVLLAGCTAPPGPTPPTGVGDPGHAVLPSHLAAGTFYAFRHGGGALSLGVEPGRFAKVELFDGQDVRLGQVQLGGVVGDRTPLRFEDLAPGDYVLRPLAINGTLLVASDGGSPALRPLSTHLERRILVQRPTGTSPPVAIPSLLTPGPIETTHVDIRLQHPPTDLRLLVAGTYSGLAVRLGGPTGTVLESSSDGGSPVPSVFGPSGLDDVRAAFHPDNVRDAHLTGSVESQDLKGVVILEATSYSRAEPLAGPPSRANAERPAFVYGNLPDDPVRFQTGPRTTHLLLTAGPDAAHDCTCAMMDNQTRITLFDGKGARIGSWSLPPNATLSLPAPASTDFILALVSGNATLGADAPPADFELHPLKVHTTVVPAAAAGSNGEYAQAETSVDGLTVFDIRPEEVDSPAPEPFQGLPTCPPRETLRILQGNETLGYWGAGLRPSAAAVGTLLHDGPVTVQHDGFGTQGCSRNAARVYSFQT
jgi:hypothetical protein